MTELLEKPAPQTHHELHQRLQDFVCLANRIIFDFYGERSSCIFSTGVICDVLNSRGLWSQPLRVTCGIFPDVSGGCVLGSDGCGQRMAAASPGHWHGHLVVLTGGRYLLDSTIDQINDKHDYGAFPVVIDLTTTEWFKPPRWEGAGLWTGLLPLFPGSVTRYSQYHRQDGWLSAPDWKHKWAREEGVRRVLAAWNPELIVPTVDRLEGKELHPQGLGQGW